MLILEGWAEERELAKRAGKEPTEEKPAEGSLQRGQGTEVRAGPTELAAEGVQVQ